jgi:outer membrane protein
MTLGYQLGSGYDQSAWYITPDSVFIQYPSYTYSQQLKDYVQHRIYLRVSIPIFQRLSNHTQISKSKIQLLDAKYALEETEKNVYKDVQSAYSDASAAWDKYLAYSESAESYKELYDQTAKRFELGMVNAIDMGIAQNNLIKAEGELLHAKYTYLLKIKILDFYRGVPITL